MTPGARLSSLFRNTFDIREGELSRALLMQGYIFLVISTLLIVKPTVNGLFLARFGVERLPEAFLLVAVVAGIVASLYARLLRRASLQRIIQGTLIFSVLSLLVFGGFLRQQQWVGPVLYLFYLWVSIFALLATSQFWVLANLLFHARQAKRLFGFIGAGAIGGGIFGGYLTSFLTQFMASENLLFVSAGLLSLCLPIVQVIWKNMQADPAPPAPQAAEIQSYAEPAYRLILRSRHLLFLSGIIGLSVIVAKLVDYQFGGVAAAMIQDPDELTAFFGFWFSTFNLLSLLLQLFLTRRVVGTFGVGASLFFLPVLICLAALVLLLFPHLLLAAVFLKMSDGSLKQSINKVAMELIILPIPQEVKKQTKSFIDVFVDSFATGISGLILILFIQGLDLSTRAISLLILGLVGLWMYLAYLVRQEYLRSFREKIAPSSLKNKRKPIDISHESVLGGWTKVLKQGTDAQCLYVLGKLREIQDPRLIEPVRPLLHSASPDVVVAALRYLYYFPTPNLFQQVEPLMEHVSAEVKVHAFEYLLAHSGPKKQLQLARYLDHSSYEVQAAALLSLALEGKGNPTWRNHFALEERILAGLNALPDIELPAERHFCHRYLLRTIGQAEIPSLYPHLYEALNSPEPEIVQSALLSMGQSREPGMIPRLLPFLVNKAHRPVVTQALLSFGHGLPGYLDELQSQGALPWEQQSLIPAILGQIGSQSAVNALFDLLDHPFAQVSQEAMRSLRNMRQQFPALTFNKRDIFQRVLLEANWFQDTLSFLGGQLVLVGEREQPPSEAKARQALIQLLERRLDRNLDRIFSLLGLNYPPEDIQTIYQGIQSSLPELRINALEFLDNLLEPNFKKMLIPLVETSMMETISEEAVRKLKIAIPDDYQCFDSLLRGKDEAVSLAVLRLIGAMQDPRFLPLLVASLGEQWHPKVERRAREVMEQLEGNE